MIRPLRYLLRMLAFLLVVALVCVLLGPGLISAFMASPFLNGVILGVAALGILHIFRQVILLGAEVRWLAQLKQETRERLFYPDSLKNLPTPRVLGPMARMLGERRGRISLSTLSMRTLLDGIQVRVDESHDLSRYLVGLLIFLGLLGTFWGLSETIGAVSDTISDLRVEGAASEDLLAQLQQSLERPLSGMGTAFTSSLFGLAASLVVGFLELQSSQAHNRFMQDLEEWLAGMTKLSAGGAGTEGDASVTAYVQALLEHTADSLDGLQRTLHRNEEDRRALTDNLGLIAERLGNLAAQTHAQQATFSALLDTQTQLRQSLQILAEQQGGSDEGSRQYLRALTGNLDRLSAEINQGRGQLIQEMRNEIRLLARTIAALADEGK
ncbi:MAG: flagellar motor protein MotA [Pseudomonadota bacterium]